MIAPAAMETVAMIIIKNIILVKDPIIPLP
jgi:hypothetical protein